MPKPDIEVVRHAMAWSEQVGDPETLCVSAAEAAWQAAGSPPVVGAVAVVLAEDPEVLELNRHYRGRAEPTNVLSFPYRLASDPQPEDPETPFGDIIIAFETAAAEAASEGRPLADHLSRLVVHGMLHLLGYDHDAPADAAAMEALEERALNAIGVAQPDAPLLTLSHE